MGIGRDRRKEIDRRGGGLSDKLQLQLRVKFVH